jgi:endonuclease YncB( thermonuclease family)
MRNAIITNSSTNRTTGFARPGMFDGVPGTAEQQVHDGDTMRVTLDGNLSVRLLGIDTPEVSFMFPGGSGNFLSIDDPKWEAFLRDPLNSRWGPMPYRLPPRLTAWLRGRCGDAAAAAHRQHAAAATQELRAQLERDMRAMQQSPATFRYYMNFGFEVMDGYGRLLCIINRNQPQANVPGPRPPSYNLRLLERGRAFPYFIWPNVNPWDRPATIEEAVIPAGQARTMANADSELRRARAAVARARSEHLGVFDAMQPLLLEPFELRNLCRRSAPGRWLIDLNSDSNILVHPLDYPSIPQPEDRLWIPGLYVHLFEQAGWRKAAVPRG